MYVCSVRSDVWFVTTIAIFNKEAPAPYTQKKMVQHTWQNRHNLAPCERAIVHAKSASDTSGIAFQNPVHNALPITHTRALSYTRSPSSATHLHHSFNLRSNSWNSRANLRTCTHTHVRKNVLSWAVRVCVIHPNSGGWKVGTRHPRRYGDRQRRVTHTQTYAHTKSAHVRRRNGNIDAVRVDFVSSWAVSDQGSTCECFVAFPALPQNTNASAAGSQHSMRCTCADNGSVLQI